MSNPFHFFHFHSFQARVEPPCSDPVGTACLALCVWPPSKNLPGFKLHSEAHNDLDSSQWWQCIWLGVLSLTCALFVASHTADFPSRLFSARFLKSWTSPKSKRRSFLIPGEFNDSLELHVVLIHYSLHILSKRAMAAFEIHVKLHVQGHTKNKNLQRTEVFPNQFYLFSDRRYEYFITIMCSSFLPRKLGCIKLLRAYIFMSLNNLVMQQNKGRGLRGLIGKHNGHS